MSSLFNFAFRNAFKKGKLRVSNARGVVHELGDGTGPLCAIHLTSLRTEIHLILDPALAFGEAYMSGDLIVEEGGLPLFLEIILRNTKGNQLPPWTFILESFRYMFRRIHQFNPRARSRRNVSAHYDITPEIYKLFLDSDMQYSCAYFENEGDSLEAAQLAKKRHLAAKLSMEPGQSVLDIGSGWGGMALYLAKVAGVKVTGITLSHEQLKISEERAEAAGLDDKVAFRLEDYRETAGPYDRIVSVGMLEHVGITYYKTFFRRIYELLDDDGVAVIHSMFWPDGPYQTSAFIKKYIFPGGAIPALSDIVSAIEASGLLICDMEVLRLHYAETVKIWRERFEANRDEAVRLKGEEFFRMWQFYLAGSEASFRFHDLMVFQIQLSRQQRAVPLTRNYIHDGEKRLSRRESAKRKN